MNFLQRRKVKKHVKTAFSQAKHVRNMREDIMSKDDFDNLTKAEQGLDDAIKLGDYDMISQAAEKLHIATIEIYPDGSNAVIREIVEIVVVVVIAVIGFRVYFIQPFKIPTGSMQPTLNGINYEYQSEPTFMDRKPLKYVKWIFVGKWYTEIESVASGVYKDPRSAANPVEHVEIGNRLIKVPNTRLRAMNGDKIDKGDVLWSGYKVAGDHVFVNMIVYNFRRPERSDVVVFNTTGIKALDQGIHYIKRLTGVPGDSISIQSPYIRINGNIIDDPREKSIQRYGEDLYHDYRLAKMDISQTSKPRLMFPGDSINLTTEYCVFGDNTKSSFDSRYWGTVPRKSFLGPAFFVYWPFGEHFGFIR